MKVGHNFVSEIARISAEKEAKKEADLKDARAKLAATKGQIELLGDFKNELGGPLQAIVT